MVRLYDCAYCGNSVEPGTGMSFVRKNGQLVRFCSRKCQRKKLKKLNLSPNSFYSIRIL
ncbi:MAG: 50S ribosomal protein L24e [Candidatus Hodarchaeales archaeon]